MKRDTMTIDLLFSARTEGERLRDEGIAKAIDSNVDWVDRFAAAAQAVLFDKGAVNADAVIQICGMPSGSPNAVGAAMRRFAIRNKLQKVGYVQSSRSSRHASITGVWAREKAIQQ